jgi:hypothetical protein
VVVLDARVQIPGRRAGILIRDHGTSGKGGDGWRLLWRGGGRIMGWGSWLVLLESETSDSCCGTVPDELLPRSRTTPSTTPFTIYHFFIGALSRVF